MNKQLKVALAVIVGAVVLCGTGYVAIYFIAKQAIGQMMMPITDPALASKIGHEIVNYTLPPGYCEQSASSTLGYKVVIIGPQSGITNAMTIVLMEYPVGSNRSREEVLEETDLTQEDIDDRHMRIVSTQTVTIQGQPVTLITYESIESGSQAYHWVSGIFPGKGNTEVTISATSVKDAWDQAVLDSFLASIK
jgi:H+/gluconate symporter-like permease